MSGAGLATARASGAARSPFTAEQEKLHPLLSYSVQNNYSLPAVGTQMPGGAIVQAADIPGHA